MSMATQLAGLLALAMQSPTAPEPPRGVNSTILGTAEEFAVPGPARVCLLHTSVDLRAGEVAYLDYLGIHHGGFRVTGPNGTFRVMEGDAWQEPPGASLVPDLLGRAVARYRREGRLAYMIYRASEYDPNDDHPSVIVEGDALGRSRDLAILARVDVSQDDPDSCDRAYFYGWEGWGQRRRVPEEGQ